MAGYTVIADVGETLVELLQSEMKDFFPGIESKIVLISPGEIDDSEIRLSLFLYRVEENEHLKNQEMRQLKATELEYKPLTLDLFYMMTAYSQKDHLDEHRILGRAMQVFYDNAILRGSVLRGSLEGTDAELRIILTTMPMENITQIWNSFENKPYKPSVFYQVTPVPIDSTRQLDAQRVVEKDMRYYQMIGAKRGQ